VALAAGIVECFVLEDTNSTLNARSSSEEAWVEAVIFLTLLFINSDEREELF